VAEVASVVVGQSEIERMAWRDRIDSGEELRDVDHAVGESLRS